MIAAVVVTFSAPADVLDRCLRALAATPGLDRIVVVDTGGSAVVADDVGDVDLHRIDNRGYGAAANHAIASLPSGTDVVLLNDDVVVQPGWLAPLTAALEADRVGAVQPVLVAADHAVVTSCGVAIDRHGAGVDVGDGDPVPEPTAPLPLEIFNGGTVLFAAAFLADTGGFDERYFLYYEDVDLARRGAELGWCYRLAPESVVEHRRGTTTGALGGRTRFLQERNRLWAAARFAEPSTIARALWLSVRRLRHEPRRTHRRALAAGLAGMPRRVVERLRAPGTRTARR